MLMAAFLCTVLVTTVPQPEGQRRAQPPALHLSGAHLYVDGESVLGPLSVQQSSFGYLYFYIPGRGLYTIGAAPFEGAARAGTFDGRTLAVSVGGTDLRLSSRSRILTSGRSDAWVTHDAAFKLNVQGVVYGYGDHPSIAEEWLERYGAAER